MITKIQHRWPFFQALLDVALTFFPGFSNNFLTIFPVSTDTSFLLSSSPKLMPPILGFSYGNALPLHQLLDQFSIATIMLHNKSSPKKWHKPKSTYLSHETMFQYSVWVAFLALIVIIFLDFSRLSSGITRVTGPPDLSHCTLTHSCDHNGDKRT